MFKLFIVEVLDNVKKALMDDEKAKILVNNTSIPLQHLLYANFNTKIKFLLPTKPTPYKPSKFAVGLGDNTLLKEFKKLYLFYEGGHPTLHQCKREQLWIQLLEGLSFSEAKVMESLKCKNLEKDYGVTRTCVDLAFPKLLANVPIELDNSDKMDSSGISTEVSLPKKKRGRKKKTGVVK